MRLKFRAALLALSCLALPGVAQAGDIITFDGLTGANEDSFTGPYAEDGFELSVTSGQFFEGHVYGNPTPNIFMGPFYAVADGSLQLVRTGGGLFGFDSFDLSGNGGLADYNVEGFLGASSLFTVTGSQGTPFATIAGAAGSIDRLVFTLHANGTSLNVDNIGVTAIRSAVPEPATWALLIMGFAAIGAAMRSSQRKQSLTVSYT